MRCLEDADVPVEVDAREVDQRGTGTRSSAAPTSTATSSTWARWAHDALALALPMQLLCRPECSGLCAVCGASLNDVDPAEHRHESGARPALGQAPRAAG